MKTRVSAASDGATVKPVGMALEPLTPDARNQYGIASNVGGALVGNVTPGGNAEDSGVQAGDVIERVGGQAVHSPDEVANAIHAAERQNKQVVSLLVMRNGVSSYLGLKLQA